MNNSVNLSSLPNRLLQEIITYTDPKTACNFGATDKNNNKISKSNHIWNYFFRKEFGVNVFQMMKVEKEGLLCELFKKNSSLLNAKNIENKKFKFEELEQVPNKSILKCIVEFQEDNIEITTTYTNTEPVEHQEIISLDLLHSIENHSINYNLIQTKVLAIVGIGIDVVSIQKQNKLLFDVLQVKNTENQFIVASNLESKKEMIAPMPDSKGVRMSTMSGNLYAYQNSEYKFYLFRMNDEIDCFRAIRIGTVFLMDDVHSNGNALFICRLGSCYIWNLNDDSFKTLSLSNPDNEIIVPALGYARTCRTSGDNLFLQTIHRTYRFSLNNLAANGECVVDKSELGNIEGDFSQIEIVEKPQLLFLGTNAGYIACIHLETKKSLLVQKIYEGSIAKMKFIGTGLFVQFEDHKIGVLKFTEPL